MAQWKRVYVPGKGYRWTDGKGNYKTNNPSFRNPANAAVDAGASAAKSTAKSAASAASKSASATAKAASRTAENERNASSNAIGYGARKKAEQQVNKAPKKSNLKGVSSTNDIESLRRGQEQARQNQLNKANQKPAKVTDKPRAIPRSQAPAGSRSAPARTSTAKPSTPSKPMEKAYGDSGKDLYMASKKNNPLMQRTFGYQTGNAPGQQKTNQQQPKPAQEARTNTSQGSKSAFESNRSSIKNDTKAKPFDASRFTQEQPKVDKGKTPGDLAKALREKRERERRNRNIG